MEPGRFWTSKHAVLGALASCAIRQSPYVCPENLEAAIFDAHKKFPDPDDYFETDCQCLRLAVRDLIERVPHMTAWNKPKKGKHEYVFVDRHSKPDPDHDFIDLDALARNVAYDIAVNELREQSNDTARKGGKDAGV